MKLVTGVMPPSNVGRKPKPLDSETVEVLFTALSESTPEEMEDENGDTKLYPAFVGPDFDEKAHVFSKDFQASADGRKYAKVLHKRVGKVVKVNVYHNGVVDSAGKPTEETRYTWRLYVPVSEYTKEEIDGILEGIYPDAEVEEIEEVEENPVETPGDIPEA